ncbi:hypothetical protein DAT35_05705 [Vitiosangium sp. GDMCC 1.1324]|nr:hypothetical protein DAT35_05705 [Vitiosangium sp. GDMCC 1.1324]
MNTTPSLGRLLAALALLGLTWTGEARAEPDDSGSEIRWGNGGKKDAFLYNALSTNHQANPVMVSVPLKDEYYASTTPAVELRYQLEDPNAREFMKYLVSCALEKGQTLSYKDRLGEAHTWEGAIGLCPEWAKDKASESCQKWVSACILARVNAYGYRVQLMMRGEHPSAPGLTPRPTVMTDPVLRYTRTRVESLLRCNAAAPGASRDCGYELSQREPQNPLAAGSVGSCKPGMDVELGVSDWSGSNMVFRVCEGLSACDSASSLAESEDPWGPAPTARFSCPRTGTFNVMMAPYDPRAGWGELKLKSLTSAAEYPAPEPEVFKTREGAFFGTLFGPNAVSPKLNIYVDEGGNVHRSVNYVQGSVYPKMYACNDPMWTNAEAYTTNRLCALMGQNCMAQPLGDCANFAKCSMAKDNDHYASCVGGDGNTYPEVITTFLHRPCDVVHDPQACGHKYYPAPPANK